MENPAELREMAKWYRDMAKVEHTDNRELRQGFAEYLERRAEAIEALNLVSDPKPSA